jgi:cell division septation protein DedD
MFESYKVNLLEHPGGSGDIQLDQNGWIHLGANHMDGGDIKYDIRVGKLDRTDIVEVWIDGYSSSNDLNIGPTVFIGAGKNRYEQITRMTGEAWRPFVFHIADDTIYGDITDPANRNEYWRMRFPSSKYEMRRIDKSPDDLIESQVLPIRISMTGNEDFIIKRIEVVVFRTAPRGHRNEVVYREKLWSDRDREYIDTERFEHIPAPRPIVEPTPKIQSPAEECPPTDFPSTGFPQTGLPPIPAAPPAYIAPVVPPASMIAPQSSYPSRGYTIQVAAYRTQSAALALCNRLRREQFDAYVVESADRSGRLYRVRVGRYPNKSYALQDANRLRANGFDTWIADLS